MKQENLLGVDVSARELVVAIRRSGKAYPLARFPNTGEGHRRLIKWATKRGKPARVGVEATGIYSFEVALALSSASEDSGDGNQPQSAEEFLSGFDETGENRPDRCGSGIGVCAADALPDVAGTP